MTEGIASGSESALKLAKWDRNRAAAADRSGRAGEKTDRDHGMVQSDWFATSCTSPFRTPHPGYRGRPPAIRTRRLYGSCGTRISCTSRQVSVGFASSISAIHAETIGAAPEVPLKRDV